MALAQLRRVQPKGRHAHKTPADFAAAIYIYAFDLEARWDPDEVIAAIAEGQHEWPLYPSLAQVEAKCRDLARRRRRQATEQAVVAVTVAPADAARWRVATEMLRTEIGDAAFDAWLRPLQLTAVVGRIATVVAPSKFLRDWFAKHHAGRLEDFIGWRITTVVACMA